MKHSIIAFLLFFLANTLCFPQNKTFVFNEDTTDFTNPGRGFYHVADVVNENDIARYKDDGISIVFKTYDLNDFKNGEISAAFLRRMVGDFDIFRRTGVKAVIRFSYTEKTTPPYGDAPLGIVLNHIQQLKPVLRDNKDVILVLQAGFIGAWGEWYYTDYFSQSPGIITPQNWADRRTLTDSLLEMMPADRMVQVRTPYYKKHLLQMEDYTPVTIEQAYSSGYIARLAHHNDCFVSSNSDVGTYKDTTVEKPYLHDDTKFTIIGGETCAQCAYSHCENALKELKRFHWTFLNRDYHTGVISDWIEEGCYPEVQKKLGYRYRMLSATANEQVKPGGTLNLTLQIINDGWANPTNPQQLNWILENTNTYERFVLKTDDDVRLWPLDDTVTLNLTAGIPDSVVAGQYTVNLQITDAEPVLAGRPEYSIRFANTDTWDSINGQNKIIEISVDNNAGGEPYNGTDWFEATNLIAGSAPLIKYRNAGETTVIYWNKNENNAQSVTVLQRSVNNSDFSTVCKSKNSRIAFTDISGLNNLYQYRIRYETGREVSPWSAVVTVQPEAVENRFVTIDVDGQSDDWNSIEPVITGTVSGELAALRFFNNEEKLFFSLESPVENYEIELKNLSGNRFAIRADSLFQIQDGNSVFIKKIITASSGGFVEGVLDIKDVEPGLTSGIYIKCFQNGIPVWQPEAYVFYLNYPILAPPANFGLEASHEFPWSRIKIKWKLNSLDDGYIIERSENDSLHFEKIAEITGSNYYLDNNLDSSVTYYYRMFSYSGLARSPFTNTAWMQPGHPSAVSNPKAGNISVTIQPVPVVSEAAIVINQGFDDLVDIKLFSIAGKQVKNIYNGMVNGRKIVPFHKNSLAGGLYYLRIKGTKYELTKKIVIK